MEFTFFRLLSKHRKAWVSNTCLSDTPYPQQTVLATLRPKTGNPEPMNFKGSSYKYDINQPEVVKNLFYYSSTRHYTRVQCFPLGV